MNVDGPPPPEDGSRVPLPGGGVSISAASMMMQPPGLGRPVGRGMPLAAPMAPGIPPPPPAGLQAGPMAFSGVGIPNPTLMQPRAAAGMPPPPAAGFGRPVAPPPGMSAPPPPPGGNPPY